MRCAPPDKECGLNPRPTAAFPISTSRPLLLAGDQDVNVAMHDVTASPLSLSSSRPSGATFNCRGRCFCCSVRPMKPVTNGPGMTTTAEGGLEIRIVVSMLQWFRWLMPRQEMFFPLFERHAEVTLKAARALRQMLDGGGELDRRCQDVTAYEQTADEITREVLVGIRTSFITPFDRADIRHLMTSMDDTIDQMQQTAKSIILFEMRHSIQKCGLSPML